MRPQSAVLSLSDGDRNWLAAQWIEVAEESREILWRAAMLAAALPAKLAPTNIVGQDIDNVRFFTVFLLQCGELLINLLVLLGPRCSISFLEREKRAISLLSLRKLRQYKYDQQSDPKRNDLFQKVVAVFHACLPAFDVGRAVPKSRTTATNNIIVCGLVLSSNGLHFITMLLLPPSQRATDRATLISPRLIGGFVVLTNWSLHVGATCRVSWPFVQRLGQDSLQKARSNDR